MGDNLNKLIEAVDEEVKNNEWKKFNHLTNKYDYRGVGIKTLQIFYSKSSEITKIYNRVLEEVYNKLIDDYLQSSLSNKMEYLKTNIEVALWFIIYNLYEKKCKDIPDLKSLESYLLEKLNSKKNIIIHNGKINGSGYIKNYIIGLTHCGGAKRRSKSKRGRKSKRKNKNKKYSIKKQKRK